MKVVACSELWEDMPPFPATCTVMIMPGMQVRVGLCGLVPIHVCPFPVTFDPLRCFLHTTRGSITSVQTLVFPTAGNTNMIVPTLEGKSRPMGILNFNVTSDLRKIYTTFKAYFCKM
jgi:hypothetical protein